MCGIFGAINYDNDFNEEHKIQFKELTDLVSYRGPDGSGYYSINHNKFSGDSSKFGLFFGHRRLSIIDLTDSAAQPMTKGTYTIVFNGEIFNYIELREELKAKGCFFDTDSDTEVIIRTYEYYGHLGFSKFNGMWAFALYDSLSMKVVLSRDRFSKKPLFYYETANNFYFSSEIKQLLPLVNKLTLNEQILFSYLKQGLLDFSTETFFNSIFKLEAKHNMIIDLNKRSIEKVKYWDYDNVITDLKNIEEEFYYLLQDSVNLRLRSDVSVGTMLSGGLDSSAITLMANNKKPDIETFSVVSDDVTTSEEPYIDIMVKHFGLKNLKLNFDVNQLLTNFNKVIEHQDEPFFNLSVLASYSILKKIKQETNITVLLNGQGGDELLMGYLKYFFFYQKNLIRQREYIKSVSLLLSAVFNRTIVNQFNLGKAKRYIPGYLSKRSSYLNEDGKELIDIWTTHSLRSRQISDIDKFSIPVLCRYEDRNSTAHSLEMRVPFLDYRLVNFCINLNDNFKINKGWTKYILRHSMKELPHSIRYRKDKKGFTIPESYFLKNQLKSSILNIEKKSILHELGIINKYEFINQYKNLLNGKGGFTEFTDITRVFIAEKWASNFF